MQPAGPRPAAAGLTPEGRRHAAADVAAGSGPDRQSPAGGPAHCIAPGWFSAVRQTRPDEAGSTPPPMQAAWRLFPRLARTSVHGRPGWPRQYCGQPGRAACAPCQPGKLRPEAQQEAASDGHSPNGCLHRGFRHQNLSTPRSGSASRAPGLRHDHARRRPPLRNGFVPEAVSGVLPTVRTFHPGRPARFPDQPHPSPPWRSRTGAVASGQGRIFPTTVRIN